MSQNKKKLGPEDLDGFGRMAERHWREHRPKLVKYLEQQGELYEWLKEAEDEVMNYMEQAQKQGSDWHAAREVALHTWILLPDIEEEDEVPEENLD